MSADVQRNGISPDLIVTLPSDPGLREAIGEVRGVTFVQWDLNCLPPAAEIDIVVPSYTGGKAVLAALSGARVRLLQWQSIGYDGITSELVGDIPLANAASVHEVATSELAVALTLAAQRDIPHHVHSMTIGRWDPRFSPGLADCTVVLIGYGGIGKRIEARLSGFEVDIARVARTPRTEQNLAGESVQVHGFAQLHEQLAQADVVIIAVPLNEETTGLIDAAALAAMPDGALLVNVARGRVVDAEALYAELREGRLRAALDVTDPEPLPADHPLWELSNALIVPHVGGESGAFLPRIAALIRRQIAHLQAGERPENLVLGDWAEDAVRQNS